MNWSETETFALLDVWSDNLIQTELGSSTRNQHVYQVRLMGNPTSLRVRAFDGKIVAEEGSSR